MQVYGIGAKHSLLHCPLVACERNSLFDYVSGKCMILQFFETLYTFSDSARNLDLLLKPGFRQISLLLTLPHSVQYSHGWSLRVTERAFW